MPAAVPSAATTASAAASCSAFLQTASRDGATASWFERNDQPTFLNGLNLAWVRYPDFTPSPPDDMSFLATVCGAEDAMRFVVENGGNALRVWLMEEPGQTLVWLEDGRVGGLAQGVLRNVQVLLEMALHYDVQIVLVLFNGALTRGSEACSLFTHDERILDSLLANAITPLAHALRGYESLALWEVINEPEGLVDLARAHGDGTPCSDARAVQQCASAGATDDAPAVDGLGWNPECRFGLGAVQRFVNRVAGALRRADGGTHPLTVGAWSLCASASDSATGATNLWRNECLVAAGGDADGTIDVTQPHAYPKEAGGTRFSDASPLHRPASVFTTAGGGRVPVIIGEVSSRWNGATVNGGGGITRRRLWHVAGSSHTTRASGSDARRVGGSSETTRASGGNATRHAARRRADVSADGEPYDMATIYREAKRLGYAGVFGWAYTCNADLDDGCVDHTHLAAGLRAGAEGIPSLTARIGRPLPARLRVGGIGACDCDGKDNQAGGYSCAEQVGWGKCNFDDIASTCTSWCGNCGAGMHAISTELPRRRCGLPPRPEPPPIAPRPPGAPPPEAPLPVPPPPLPPLLPSGVASAVASFLARAPAAAGLPSTAQAGAGVALMVLAFAAVGPLRRGMRRPCETARSATAPRPLARGGKGKGKGTFVASEEPPSAAVRAPKAVKGHKARDRGPKRAGEKPPKGSSRV